MRSALLLIFGVSLCIPSPAEASCFRRSCHGCFGCFGYRCSGCYGARCYGGRCLGCAGCYGNYDSYGPHVAYQSQYFPSGATGWHAGDRPLQYLGTTSVARQTVPDSSVQRTSNYFDPAQPGNRKVRLEVMVFDPADKIFVEGSPTTSTGMTRTFESPELDLHRDYVYTIAMKRNWDQNVVDTRTVSVRAGETVVIDFTRPAKGIPEELQAPR